MQPAGYTPIHVSDSDPSGVDCEYAGSSWNRLFFFSTSKWTVPKAHFSCNFFAESCHSNYQTSEDELRKDLKYFFLNPCEKYKTRKRKPYKLGIQICKIAMITIQLIMFGQSNQHIVSFMNDNIQGIKHIVLPTNSEIYTTEELSHQINYIQKQFDTLQNTSLGIYGYAATEFDDHCKKNSSGKNNYICFCLHEYTDISLKTYSFKFDPKAKQKFCAFLEPWSNGSTKNESNVIPLINGTLLHLHYGGIISIKLHFAVQTALLQSLRNPNLPDCYKVETAILFDNSLHSGKISRSLNTTFTRVECNNKIYHNWFSSQLVCDFVFDCSIILICTISILLCSRSMYRAGRLCLCFEKCLMTKYETKLTLWDKMEFFNGWFFLIIVSDLLTIAGSVSKIVIDFKWVGVLDYNSCSLFLGLGCLCVWIGVLRYVGYFHQYNILVLTLKRSVPHVLRFMVCASILYLGFLFCGWVVLGPYHHKFRNPVVTSEALFSLINGDDMFMTYEEMPHDKPIPWVFSQIYLYTFISLFIYIVLSLFIAVIMETYETIKECQTRGFPPQTVLQKFMDGNSVLIPNDETSPINEDSYFCCGSNHN